MQRPANLCVFFNNVINRLTKITYPDATKVYTYDNRNLVTAVTQGNQTLSFDYNKLRRLTKATDIYNRSISYAYDELGNCTGVTLPNAKSFTYQYDELRRLTQIINPNGDIFGYTYDAVGRRTQLSYPNGKTATYDYDGLNRLTALNNGVQSYSYTYDKMFNIKSITSEGKTTGYDYDLLYRLTKVTNPDETQEDYTYDEVGNRLTKTVGANTTNYTYDASNRMLTAGSAQYSYDALGNTMKKIDGADTYEYGYNSLNNLTTVKKNAQEIARYGYDPLGRRVSQTSGGKTTQSLWDDYSLVGEYVDAGVEKAIYTIGSGIDEVLAINNGSANYAYSDHLGSVTAILDSSGNNVLNRTYDAFGNVTSTSGDYQSNIGFTGREVDGSGLVYLRNRYYDPQVGRFIAKDPIGDGDNWYAFCGNNPISFVDPFGLAPVIKPGSAGGPTAGKPFPNSVKAAVKAADPTSTCVYCGREGKGTQVDHVIPRAVGGNATEENGQLACPHCNPSKGAGEFPKTPPEDFQGKWPPEWWGKGSGGGSEGEGGLEGGGGNVAMGALGFFTITMPADYMRYIHFYGENKTISDDKNRKWRYYYL